MCVLRQHRRFNTLRKLPKMNNTRHENNPTFMKTEDMSEFVKILMEDENGEEFEASFTAEQVRDLVEQQAMVIEELESEAAFYEQMYEMVKEMNTTRRN